MWYKFKRKREVYLAQKAQKAEKRTARGGSFFITLSLGLHCGVASQKTSGGRFLAQ